MKHHKDIQAFPSLNARKLFTSRTHDDPILAGTRIRFYASGRAALFHAVKSLSLSADSVILLPAYNCGVEVEAVLRAGCAVDFYRTNNDLTMDLKHIAEKITVHTKAIIVPHYFGFPQEMSGLKELCHRRDIVVIEDCAHALYSQKSNGRWLGTEGDLALFSMRKTVSMPNGGAVLVNRDGFIIPGKGKRYFGLSLIKGPIKSILEYEKNQGGDGFTISGKLLAFYNKYISTPKGSGETSAVEDERWYYDVPYLDYEMDISAVSLFCSKKEDHREIVAGRRRNYESLKNILMNQYADDFVFPELPSGTCPLCFPLFVKERDTVTSRMTASGVIPYIFGRHPHPLVHTNKFPGLNNLTGSIIGLPIHQQLSQEDIETVADTFIRSRER